MGKTMRRFAWLCVALFLALSVSGSGHTAFAESDPAPTPEDFAGEYSCTTISFGSNIVPLQEEPYTLTIDGDEAVITGISELGTDPKKLQFEDGELYWVPPEENVRVFTLRLQEEGLVTLTFDGIPEAPVFRFDPVLPSLEDYAGKYVGKTISFGETMIPLDEKEYYSLAIEGDEATISEGIITGTNGPEMKTIKLIYENGELFWQPEDTDVRVFAMHRAQDGSLTITFEGNPNIPVFHFDPEDLPQ